MTTMLETLGETRWSNSSDSGSMLKNLLDSTVEHATARDDVGQAVEATCDTAVRSPMSPSPS